MEKTRLAATLRFKVTMFILIGALLQCVVILWITYQYINKTIVDTLQEQGLLIAESIEEQAAELMLEEDVIGLKKIIEKYRHQKSNEYIIIVDADYNILVDTYNGAVPSVLTGGEAYRSFDITSNQRYIIEEIDIAGRSVYDIRLPIKEGFLGFVRIGLKQSYATSRVNAAIGFIGLVIFAGAFVAIAIALWVITRQISRPIGQLIESAREISMGNFNAPVKINTNNELQELAIAIERMKESLKTSLERLKTRSTIGRF